MLLFCKNRPTACWSPFNTPYFKYSLFVGTLVICMLTQLDIVCNRLHCSEICFQCFVCCTFVEQQSPFNAIQFNTTTQQTSHNSYRNLVTLVGTPNIHSLQQQQQHMGNISSLESLPCDGRPPVTRHVIQRLK